MGFRLTAEWINVATVVLPLILILLRPMARWYRGLTPWVRSSVRHDFVAGVGLPSYFGLFYSFLQPGIINDLNHHILALAGGLAILTFFTEMAGDIEREAQAAKDKQTT